jgi:hypothetical protein
MTGDLHEADGPRGRVNLADDHGTRGRVRVRHSEASDVDHRNGEDTVAHGG